MSFVLSGCYGIEARTMFLFVVFGFSFFLRWSGTAPSKRMSQSQTAKGVDFESDEVIVLSLACFFTLAVYDMWIETTG